MRDLPRWAWISQTTDGMWIAECGDGIVASAITEQKLREQLRVLGVEVEE